jgi:hypothetical protein
MKATVKPISSTKSFHFSGNGDTLPGGTEQRLSQRRREPLGARRAIAAQFLSHEEGRS